MSQLKISIVTVCLNSEKTLERTMVSVFSQNDIDVEYIVIDGGSSDGTLDIIHKYENRIAFWSSTPDRGIYDAMNKGIDHAHGDIIAFLNSDDWYAGDVLRIVEKVFESSGVGIVFGDYSYVTESRIMNKKNKNFELDSMKAGRVICHQCMFFRRELFDIYGNYDLRYNIAADYAWMLNAYNEGVCFKYIPVNICYFTAGGVSSHKKSRNACKEEIRKIALHALKEHEKPKYLPLIEFNNSVDTTMNEASDLANRLIQFASLEGRTEKIFYQGKEDIILFGSGNYAEECIRICNALEIKIKLIVDNDRKKWGTLFHNIEIHSPAYLSGINGYIVISSVLYENDIAKQLEEMGFVRNVNYVTMVDWEKNVMLSCGGMEINEE